MNILVTGGAGFIGINLIERLIKENNDVICIDDFSLGKRENIAPFLPNDRFTFYEKDISSTENLLDIVDNHNIDYIFYLAANSDIQLSGQSPLVDYKKTFLTTFSLFECMRQKNIKRMSFSLPSVRCMGKNQTLHLLKIQHWPQFLIMGEQRRHQRLLFLHTHI
ncbi:hypothetical protein FACS1894137_10570 [Spirochaetia bacterium]|nr:hypothetical protein FACS1894137_10570 [Spirochaetia bacterium]